MADAEVRLTKDQIIIDRVKQGWKHMRPHASKADSAARRYRDPSASGLAGAGTSAQAPDPTGGARDLPKGEVNYLAINVRQKLSAICFNNPDFAVTCTLADNEKIVREYLRDKWRKGRWARIIEQVYLDRTLSGMGFLAYLWDPTDGFVLEYCAPREMIFDPHTMDTTWNRPRWAGRRIRMPLEDAKARYGAAIEAGLSDTTPGVIVDSPEAIAQVVEVDLYWDAQTEAEVFGDRVLRIRPNLYQQVPILVIQGDINPQGPFALGDYDEAHGAFEMFRDLMRILNRTARHGGGYAWCRKDMIDDSVVDEVVDGTYDGVIPLNGATGEEAFGYTEVMPVSDATLRAIDLVSAGVDADQAVNQYQRGATTRDAKFATQAALEISTSGARAARAQEEFEAFCEEIARRCVEVSRLFGLDDRAGDPTEDETLLWEALCDVDDLRVIRESAAWKDPGVDQQAAMTLLKVVVETYEMFMQAYQAGLVTKVPNLEAYLNDVLRAFRRREQSDYWVQPAMPMMPQPGVGPGAPMDQGADAGSNADPAQQPSGATPEQQLPPGSGIGGLVPRDQLQEAVNGRQ